MLVLAQVRQRINEAYVAFNKLKELVSFIISFQENFEQAVRLPLAEIEARYNWKALSENVAVQQQRNKANSLASYVPTALLVDPNDDLKPTIRHFEEACYRPILFFLFNKIKTKCYIM